MNEERRIYIFIDTEEPVVLLRIPLRSNRSLTYVFTSRGRPIMVLFWSRRPGPQ